MVSKLSFKGEKPKKRKSKSSSDSISKKSKPAHESLSSSTSKADSQVPVDSRSWISAEDVNDISGPVVFGAILGDSSQPELVCLSSDGDGKVSVSTDLDTPSSLSQLSTSVLISYIEPLSTQQVFVIQPANFDDSSKTKRAAITKTGDAEQDTKRQEEGPKIAFKTSNGRFLGANADGTVHSKATAISNQQTFTIVFLKDDDNDKSIKYFALKTTWKTYLTIRKSKSASSGYSVSARPLHGSDEDEDEDGSDEGHNEKLEQSHRLIIRMQARNQKEYQRKVSAMENGSKYNSESYISSQVLRDKAGRDLTRDEIKALKKAYAQGQLNEALLDLREKSKTDTRCF